MIAICEYTKQNPQHLEKVEQFLTQQKMSSAHQQLWHQVIREVEKDRQVIKRQDDIRRRVDECHPDA